jgi:hypothetical protein
MEYEEGTPTVEDWRDKRKDGYKKAQKIRNERKLVQIRRE